MNMCGTKSSWIAPVIFPLLALSLPVSLAAADIFTLDAHIINAGSALAVGNSCSRLQASIGETASGYSTGGGFSLVAGFQAIAAAGKADTLFFDGFQGCVP
jgi:hypothetical protein